MRVAVRSGVVALVAAAVTAAVVAVTGASAEQDPVSLSTTTTTTEAPLGPIDLEDKRLVPFSCGDELAALTRARPDMAPGLAQLVSEEIGWPVIAIDAYACTPDQRESEVASSGRKISGAPPTEPIERTVDLMFGPFATSQEACDAKALVQERLQESSSASRDEEEFNVLLLLAHTLRVARPGYPDLVGEGEINCASGFGSNDDEITTTTVTTVSTTAAPSSSTSSSSTSSSTQVPPVSGFDADQRGDSSGLEPDHLSAPTIPNPIPTTTDGTK